MSEQAGMHACLLLLEVALAGKRNLRLGWDLLCSSGLVAAMSGIPAPGQGRGSEHLNENGVLQAPDPLTGFQFSESPDTCARCLRDISQSFSKEHSADEHVPLLIVLVLMQGLCFADNEWK